MSIYDDFGRLQDSINALMGDFGHRQGGRGGRRRHGGGQGGQGGLWGDMGFGDPFLDMDFYSLPLLTSGPVGSGQQQGGQLWQQGKGQEETKMDESAGGSSLIPQQQGGQLGQWQQGGALQLPVLRCRVNVEEQKDKYLVTAEVPGFDKENLKVHISDDHVLSITGEQRKEHVEESKEKKYIRTERSFGRVQRSLQLPKNVAKEGVSASYENGILHVNIPKQEELQPQKQEVQIS